MTKERQAIEIEDIPEANMARVLGASLKLAVVADGNSYVFKLSRQRLYSLLESGFDALKELEPGWREL